MKLNPSFYKKPFCLNATFFLTSCHKRKKDIKLENWFRIFLPLPLRMFASTLFAALALFFCRQELAKCMHAPPLTRTHAHAPMHTSTLTLSRSTRDPDESCNKSRSNFELGFFAKKLMISSSSPSSHCWQLHRKKLFM